MLSAARLAATALRRSSAAAGRGGVRQALGNVALPQTTASMVHPGLQAARQAMRLASSAAAKDVAQMSAMQQVTHYKDIYKKLSKWRLSQLVVASALGGYVVGSGPEVDLKGLFWLGVGTMGASACANSINQWWEVETDRLMKRTMHRPLPAGLITRPHALAFAALVGVSGVGLLAWKCNPLTAVLGMGNIALYTMVYTPLKRVHMSNTWVGAVVGAIPPLMGWAAASGQLDVGASILAGLLYFWQLPHFMALAWMCRADYAAGGYKMMSLTDPTGRRVAATALRNSLYMVPLGFASTYLGVTTPAFAVECGILSAIMGSMSATFLQRPGMVGARALFRGSLMHLPILMGCMIFHRIPNQEAQEHEAPLTWAYIASHLAFLHGPYYAAKEAVGLGGKEDAEAAAGMRARDDLQASLDFHAVWLPQVYGALPLPLPPLPMRRGECPSRAYCEEDKGDGGRVRGAEGAEGAEEAEQGGVARRRAWWDLRPDTKAKEA